MLPDVLPERNIARMLGVSLHAAAAVLALGFVCTPLAAAVLPHTDAVVTIAADDGRSHGDGGAGTAERRDNLDEPSEDGTDSEPDAARPGGQEPGAAQPEAPPGCSFRRGPLELLV
jgi:hypothetical protein